MKKFLKVTGIIFGIILFLVSAFLAVWFWWPWHSEFYDNAKAEFKIPGLETKFVPQAFTKIDGQNKYIVGGYMSDGSASRFYIVNGETEQAEKYFTLTNENEDYIGHACGIASDGNNLWTCSNDGEGGTAYRFSLSDVESAEDAGKVEILDSFKTNNGADNIFVHNDILWVGEFYREGNYETPDEHRIETTSGEMNYAVAYGYNLNSSNANGLEDTIPDKALSLTDQVQGMAITETGEIVLSTSYSLPDSVLYCYEDVLSEEKHSTIEVDGNEVDLWFLDNNSLKNEFKAPAMTEEIVINDGRLYVLSESACKKYKLFTRDSVKDVYSLPVEYVIGEN